VSGADAALLGYLAGQLHDVAWLDSTVRPVSGGRSNLTLFVSGPAGEVVVRRPPTGDLLPGAHDVLREHRILAALARTDLPVPDPLLVCADETVLGVPFFVMSRVVGHVIRQQLPPGYLPAAPERDALATGLVDSLVRLHGLTPSDVDLPARRPVDSYPRYQVELWTRQWIRAGGDAAAVARVADRLLAALPVPQRTSVLHGDFRLDNVVLHPRDPGRVNAILDWELSATGDPLVDLALFLVYWSDASDEPDWRAGVGVVPLTSAAGFPGRREVADRYGAATGLDLTGLSWYIAGALLKLAGIYQGIAARSPIGGRAEFARRARLVLDHALQVASTGVAPGL
jgi:aminoglycoside phosphotransferase (APT) family kinase protein